MTTAKAHHRAARTLLLRHLDMHPGQAVGNDLDPDEVGIVGDTDHAAGGDSYHLGKDQIRARNGRDRYSVDESARDRNGLDNNASALDVGSFRVSTPRGTFTLRDFSRWLVGLCKDGDPDARDLREVIYSPDGRTVRRWDREGRRTSGDDSHLFHTHLSEYRDADGHRMVALATRWLQHIGLLPEEDEVAFADEKIKVTATTGAELFEPDLKAGTEVEAGSLLQLAAIWARRAGMSTDTLESGLSALALALAERHTELVAGQARLTERVATIEQWLVKLTEPASDEQTAALLRAVLGARAAQVGRILAAFED